MTNLIIDTDFLYGLFVKEDPHHTRCHNFLPELENFEIFISHLVISELVTLVSRRISQKAAIDILQQVEILELNVLFTDEILYKQAIIEFQKYSKKNISMVDCTNLVLAQKYKAKIATFDSFYPKEFLL